MKEEQEILAVLKLLSRNQSAMQSNQWVMWMFVCMLLIFIWLK